MKKMFISIATTAFVFVKGCSVSNKVIIPLSKQLLVEDTYTIIWNGTSTAYRFANEKWERTANYDKGICGIL